MPHYEVHYSCHLEPSQQDVVASALTSLHCRLFSAPSIFVNVSFQVAHGNTQRMYVGGKPHITNYIIAHIRPRRPENKEKLNTLVQEITEIWNKYARPVVEEPALALGGPTRALAKHKELYENADLNAPGRLDDPRALHNCFIMEDIAAGAEQGFILPTAGQDGKWLEDNMEAFRKRAAEGDESMQGLLEEVQNGVGTGPVAKSEY